VKVVVSDSSPLNYLALMSDFDLLRKIYGSVILPPAVCREVVENAPGYPVRSEVLRAKGRWVSLSDPPDAVCVLTMRREYRLDLGKPRRSWWHRVSDAHLY
jgi:predicted nucleic acid-binding protein